MRTPPLEQRLAGAADDGHHRGVAVGDVGELVGDDGLELARLEQVEQALGQVQAEPPRLVPSIQLFG